MDHKAAFQWLRDNGWQVSETGETFQVWIHPNRKMFVFYHPCKKSKYWSASITRRWTSDSVLGSGDEFETPEAAILDVEKQVIARLRELREECDLLYGALLG